MLFADLDARVVVLSITGGLPCIEQRMQQEGIVVEHARDIERFTRVFRVGDHVR